MYTAQARQDIKGYKSPHRNQTMYNRSISYFEGHLICK